MLRASQPQSLSIIVRIKKEPRLHLGSLLPDPTAKSPHIRFIPLLMEHMEEEEDDFYGARNPLIHFASRHSLMST